MQSYIQLEKYWIIAFSKIFEMINPWSDLFSQLLIEEENCNCEREKACGWSFVLKKNDLINGLING